MLYYSIHAHYINLYYDYYNIIGLKSIDELIGRSDLLEIDPSALHYKNQGLDLSALLIPAQTLNPTGIIYLYYYMYNNNII